MAWPGYGIGSAYYLGEMGVRLALCYLPISERDKLRHRRVEVINPGYKADKWGCGASRF